MKRNKPLAKFGLTFLAIMMTGHDIAFAYDDEFIPIMTVALEARGDGMFSMVGVGEVIRRRSEKTGRSVNEVCLKRKQFSCWNDTTPYEAMKKVTMDEFQRARSAWAMSENTNLTRGSRHYHALSVKPYWAKGHQSVAVLGTHAFYNDVK